MKVGDLVQLSAYGRQRQFNSMYMDYPSQTGLIIGIVNNASYPYRVRWSKRRNPMGQAGQGFHRRELKYATFNS